MCYAFGLPACGVLAGPGLVLGTIIALSDAMVLSAADPATSRALDVQIVLCLLCCKPTHAYRV
jgi:hypothetical protein